MLSFETAPYPIRTALAIADRAVRMAAENGLNYKKMEALMDVSAAHANGCPLDMDALLAADDSNFAHDVFGIRRHIDRTTGKLGDCFFPRFAKVSPRTDDDAFAAAIMGSDA